MRPAEGRSNRLGRRGFDERDGGFARARFRRCRPLLAIEEGRDRAIGGDAAIVSAKVCAIESWTNFEYDSPTANGMVFVTTTRSISDPSSTRIASPAKMPCVATVYTCVAPRALIASAAFASVPPVEIMSSTTTAIFPFTSPTMSVTSETSGSGRRLKTIASELSSRLAKSSARCTPPASGETTTMRSLQSPSPFK